MFVVIFAAARGAASRAAARRRKGLDQLPPSDTADAQADAKERREQRVERRQCLREAVARNRSIPVFAGQLTETRNGCVGKTRRLQWVVLDPAAGTFSIWQKPPATQQAAITAEMAGQAEATSNGETCAICLEECRSGAASSKSICGHWFHVDCLNQWRAQHANGASCPTCRRLLGDVPLLVPPRLRSFGQAGKADKSSAPKKAERVFQLVRLELMEINPYFRTMFLHFEGRKVLTLTAELEEDFLRWEQVFRLYCDLC